jgi:F-type H+-transporting ATPase subunit b
MRGIASLAVTFCLSIGLAGSSWAEEAESSAAHNEHAAAEHGGHHELGHGNATDDLEKPEEFRTDLAIYTFVVFMLLLAILSRFAWPKISEALKEREKRIEGDLAAAAAKHEEAKRLLAEHEAKLTTAAGDVRAMLEEARRDAEATGAQIVADARAAAGQERQRAVRDIEIASDEAMKRLAETTANLAVELAGKAIRETLVPAKRAELVREALQKLGDSSPSKN